MSKAKTKAKDPDQQAVYYAERVTFVDTLYDEPMHSSELLYLAGCLFDHDWWVKHKIPVPTIEPTGAKYRSSHATTRLYRGGGSVIRLAPCDINPWVLAHEAAHVAQFHFYNPDYNSDMADHGQEFRACYLNVAEILLGRGAAEDLNSNFDRHIFSASDSIVTVPSIDRSLDSDGIGIFPRWRMREQATEFEGLRQRIAATTGTPRLNGAIAL